MITDAIAASELAVRAVNIAVLSFCSLELFILLLGFPRFTLRVRSTRLFYSKMVVSTFTILCYAISFIYGPDKTDVFNVLMRSLAYVGLYAVFVLYIAYLREQIHLIERNKKIPEWVIYLSIIVGIVGALLWILSLFSDTFKELNSAELRYGRIFFIGHIGGFVLIIIAVVIILSYSKALGRRQTIVLMSMPVLMLAATLAEPFAHGVELRYPAIVLEFLIIYTQHHLELEGQREVQQTQELRQRVNLATGRMKPHYLYNVLTTIYYLCETDPSRAQHAIGTFSEYLRSTLEALDKQELVSFKWELDEIRNYLVLEKIRFGDKLNVIYDVEYDEFMVPPLTIQPLVENAVLHGIGAKENGGTIRIESRKLPDGGAQIRIKDDGVGFDVDSIYYLDNTNEGIANVRERLRLEVGGDMIITSSEGKGTTVLVTIRKQ